MKIERFSHNFTISEVEPRFSGLVKGFVRQFHEFEEVTDPTTGKSSMQVLRTYAFWPMERDIIRCHISALDEFLTTLSLHPELANITVKDRRYEMTDAITAEFKIKHIHTPFDYQKQLIREVTTSLDNNEVITLPPGAGKTLTAFHIMATFKKRTFIMMRGGYLDRWIPDLDKTFDFKQGGLLRIQGQSNLSTLMEMVLEGEVVADVIITTIDTVATFMDEYENHPQVRCRYPIPPADFFQKLGVGLLVFDEGHQNAYKAMRIFCHANVPMSLTLSATLNTRGAFKNRIYKILYPLPNRRDAGYRNVYVGVNALMFRFNSLRGIRTTGYKGSYSHVNFEQSLLRGQHRKTLAGYLGLVKYSIDLKFMKDYLPGTKCLVFFATVNMCDKAVKYLKEKYPDLRVVRYVAKDKMDVFDGADIIVSTVLSAGTAVDIVDLRTTIMTTAIDSEISNQQARGRTRPIKSYPDKTPEFCYFVCLDIQKHMMYHRNKKEFFDGWVVYHTEVMLPYAA